MKNQILLFVSLFVSATMYSQKEEKFLNVEYKVQLDVDPEILLKTVPASVRSQVEPSLREELSKGIFADYILKSSNTKSVFEYKSKIDNSQSTTSFILKELERRDKYPYVKDFSNNIYIKGYDLANKIFYVKEKLPKIDWKIAKESTTILGLKAIEGTGKVDSINVHVWYTPDIKYKDGPFQQSGLPGLIVKSEFYVGDIKMTATATNIEIINKPLEIADTKSKKFYSKEEFEKQKKEFEFRQREYASAGVDKN